MSLLFARPMRARRARVRPAGLRPRSWPLWPPRSDGALSRRSACRTRGSPVHHPAGGEFRSHARIHRSGHRMAGSSCLPAPTRVAYTSSGCGRWMLPQRVPLPGTLGGTRSVLVSGQPIHRVRRWPPDQENSDRYR
jgi:hypothetical protein